MNQIREQTSQIAVRGVQGFASALVVIESCSMLMKRDVDLPDSIKHDRDFVMDIKHLCSKFVKRYS